MNREVHVGFCEGVGVKFPRATRPLIHTFGRESLAQNAVGGSKGGRVYLDLANPIKTFRKG